MVITSTCNVWIVCRHVFAVSHSRITLPFYTLYSEMRTASLNKPQIRWLVWSSGMWGNLIQKSHLFSMQSVSWPTYEHHPTCWQVSFLCSSLEPSGYYIYRNVEHSLIPPSAHTVYLCVLCGSENKQRLFPYTALTDWFYNQDGVCLLRGTDWMCCVDLRTKSDYFPIQH